MAFADSLNPCAITVLLILIALSAATVGIWKTGASYILGNFCAYLLVGLGLFTILRQFNLPIYTSKVIGAATMVLALVSLFLKIPEGSKPTISKLLHAATSPIFAFFAGAAISAIELPCTGGPYFLTLTLMSQYNIPQWATLGYLLLYNTIFVLPLVAVLLIYHFAHAPEIPKKYIRWTSAILLFLLGLVIILI
jgi:cytochrome c biogenesis protein CcdA